MNSKKIVAIPKSKAWSVCMNCLQEHKKIVRISIPMLGYGSGFDEWGTQIHLCKECYKKSNPKLWELKKIVEEYSEEYENESQIFAFINNLPIQSQELIYNTYAYGSNTDHSMKQQDWIDFHFDELSHEKCKEYGCFSPEECKAYQERFPMCQYPYYRVYQDGSRGCWCALHHAHGEYGQRCGSNISDECYHCTDYVKRLNPIQDIIDTEANDYELYIKMTLRQSELAKKFNS